MRPFRDISIQRKVTLVILLTSLFALVLTMVALLVYEVFVFEENALKNLSSEAGIIAVSAQPALDFDDKNLADEILSRVKANHQIAAACIYDKDGMVFASCVRADLGSYEFPVPEIDSHRFEKNSLLLFRHINSGSDMIGQVFLRYDLESPFAALPHYAAIFGVISLVLLVIALFFAAWLQRLISRPILELARSAQLVKDRGDFSARVPKYSEDECGQLTDTFNDMLDALQKGQDELARHASELERRVEERTASQRETIAFLESFCYTIAHDLRAPLRSMAGFAAAIVDDYGPRLDEAGRHYAQRIIDSAQRMDRLIMDLLVFGRLSQQDLTFSALDLNAMTQKVVQTLGDDIQTKRAEITVQPNLPEVWGNNAVLEQILTNLIANALKFCHPDSRPRIRVGAQTTTNGKNVRLWVHDNGIGIAPEHHERIFRAFERLHSNNEYTGTGIGLAIVKQGVERMKGHVGVDSASGQGSTFWIELPRAEAA